MLPEHRWPFLAELVKDHHTDAGILEGLTLLLIQPLLKRLVVVRTIDEHQRRRFPIGEIGGDEMAAHFLLGVIGQVMAKAEGGLEPEALQTALAEAEKALQPFAAAVAAALTYQLSAGQIEQELLELRDAAIDPIVLTLVVITEQAAIATGFAVRIGILESCPDRWQRIAQAPVTYLQRCAAQLPQC